MKSKTFLYYAGKIARRPQIILLFLVLFIMNAVYVPLVLIERASGKLAGWINDLSEDFAQLDFWYWGEK